MKTRSARAVMAVSKKKTKKKKETREKKREKRKVKMLASAVAAAQHMGPGWHRLDGYVLDDGGFLPGMVNGVPVFVQGKLNDIPVIQVPMAASPDQINEIAKAFHGASGVSPFVITSNVKLLKLVAVTENEAMVAIIKAKEAAAARAAQELASGTSQSVGSGPQPNGDGAGNPVDDRSEISAEVGEHPPAEQGPG